MKNTKRLTYRKGFSLIELLVVISIIATLTAIILPNFMSARERARDGQKKQDLAAIKNALRLYYNDNQTYPNMSCGEGNCLSSVGGFSTYFPTISALSFTYAYEVTGGGDGFILTTQLESSQGDDDIESQSKCGKAIVQEGYFSVCAQ